MLIVLPLLFFLLQKSLLRPFFFQDVCLFWFKNHYLGAFSWELFYQGCYLLSTPTAFSVSLSLSMIPECFNFLTSLLPSAHFHHFHVTNSTVVAILCIFRQTARFAFWTLLFRKKIVSCQLFWFINVVIFSSAEMSNPAGSYIHPPLIFGHSLWLSPIKKCPCCVYY